MSASLLAIFLGVAALTACSVQKGMKNMQKDTRSMRDTTEEMKESTDTVAEKTEKMSETTDKMSGTTERMAGNTEKMLGTTETMSNTTEKMAATTDKMAATTDEMKVATDDLRQKSENLYLDLRQGDSLRIRTEAISEMKNAKTQAAKIVHAGHYFMAFEFQLWKNSGNDDQRHFDYLCRDAMMEFMRTATEFLPSKWSVSPLGKDADMMNLYALVTSMHMLNSSAEIARGSSALSVMDLLESSLRAKADLEKGVVAYESMPEYQKSVLEFEDTAIYLLKLRMNFMPAIVVQKLSVAEGRDVSMVGGLWMALKPWTAHTDDRNIVEIESYKKVIQEAKEMGDFLVEIGAEPEFDKTLFSVLGNLRLDQEDTDSTHFTGRESAITELGAEIKGLLSPR